MTTAAPVADAVAHDEKLKRRKYMREMMRSYRKEHRNEVRFLEHHVRHLEEEMEKFMQKARKCKVERRDTQGEEDGFMQWRDVAQGLREASEKSQADNNSLMRRAADSSSIVRDMQRWVASTLEIQRSPNAKCLTWRNVSLLSNPLSRRLGKEWITQQMYHNTDRMFVEYGFPDIRDDHAIYDLNLEFTSTCYQGVFRRQVTENIAFNAICAMYRQDLCTLFCLDGFRIVDTRMVTEVTPNTSLHQIVNKNNEWISLLCGEFHERDRSIFVVQQIQDDEKHGDEQRHQRNRMIWTEIRQLPGGAIKRRVLYLISQSFTSTGYVSLDDDSKLWGIDLRQYPEHEKERRFRQYGIQVFTKARVDGIWLAKANLLQQEASTTGRDQTDASLGTQPS
ncbi:Aste57867_825 [Aphanomyces stellatus]|uniref:Aste57867_825 protein n=1 Tax=Aphanomyces stellatus TaxID=120398 RepID=A0A485K4L3_9STRA|nr:hypothetical protein As57867_000824 [Aphanomyces stellatus]VFT78049.1 Aste57867_825 [Aphanomyces stellatus]